MSQRFQQKILGRKLGMTQLFDEIGNKIPVTVIQAGPCVVVRKKLPDTDGYSALVVGFEEAIPQPKEKDRLIKKSRHWLNRPRTRFFEKNMGEQVQYFKVVKEIRLPEDQVDLADVGDEIKADLFEPGDFVDVTGTSKGRGFAGGMKRHNWRGQVATHGTHEFFRHGGAIGAATYPGRVFPGHNMPGQMGNKKVTTLNLRVVGADPERNLLFIRGAVPGANHGLVIVKRAVKKSKSQ